MNIPDYTLLQNCGKGAYGEVWLAKNRTNKLVALKCISSSQASDREYNGLLNYSQLPESPNLIRILHLGRVEEGFFYTMELADGLYQNGQYVPETLAERIKNKKKLLPGEVMELAYAILNALATLHAAGMIHRDIKPENILYFNGVPKLSDMGLVRHTQDTVSLCGTIGFIPPERLVPGNASLPYDKSDDLYALGKVLYCAMTGNSVEKFPSYHEDMIHNTLCSHINQVILKACGKREERFSNVKEFFAALHNGIPADPENGKNKKRQFGQKTFFTLTLFISCLVTLHVLFLLEKFKLFPFPEPQNMDNVQISALVERKISDWEKSNKIAAILKKREPRKVIENKQEKGGLYTFLASETQEMEAKTEKLHLNMMRVERLDERKRIVTPEKIQARERLYLLLEKREKKEGKLRHFNSAKELEIYKLVQRATQMKGGLGGGIDRFAGRTPYKPILIYENAKTQGYPALDLGAHPRKKISHFSLAMTEKDKTNKKLEFKRLKNNNKKIFIYAAKHLDVDVSPGTPAKEKVLYSGKMPEEFALRCKILTEFDKIMTYHFGFRPEKEKTEKFCVNVGVIQTLSYGSVLHVEVQVGEKIYTTNFMNYLISLADFCFNNEVLRSPNEFFYLELIKTRKNFAVYINDVLMVNLPGKFDLKSGRLIQHANAENSVESMKILAIPADKNCSERERYYLPDHPSQKKW